MARLLDYLNKGKCIPEIARQGSGVEYLICRQCKKREDTGRNMFETCEITK